MKRWTVLLYGVASYLIFFSVFLYAVLFVGNFWIERTLDSPPRMNLLPSLLINFCLLSVFAVQHSGMARQGFKNWLTRIVPEPAERSTYVLLSNIAMILIFAFWQPLGGIVWVDADEAIDAGLESWVDFAAEFVGALPPK